MSERKLYRPEYKYLAFFMVLGHYFGIYVTQEWHDYWLKKPIDLPTREIYSHIIRVTIQQEYGVILNKNWLVTESEFMQFVDRFPESETICTEPPGHSLGNEMPEHSPNATSLEFQPSLF